MDFSSLLSSLAGLFKIDAALIKTGEITGIKADEVSAIKTGNISVASNLKEIKISAIDRSNRIENLTCNFIPITNEIYQVNLQLDTPDKIGKLISIFAPQINNQTLPGHRKSDVLPQRIPLKVAKHIIIEDPAWFHNGQTYRVTAQTVLIPVKSKDETVKVNDVLEANRTLQVDFTNGVPTKISLNWGSASTADIRPMETLLIGNSEWTFSKIDSEKPTYLDDDKEIVLSCGSNVIGWRLRRIHKPASAHEPRPPQQLIFSIQL